MRVEFVIAERGCQFYFREYDINRDCTVLIRLVLFWKKTLKVWTVEKLDGDGRCAFSTYREGKRVGWEFQAPIRRIT